MKEDQHPIQRQVIGMLAICFIFICMFSIFGHAQQVTASISGTVKDPGGAVLPQTNITVINVNTGKREKATSDATGLYIFPSLPVGAYTLLAEHDGFANTTLSGIALQVYQKAVVDILMQVGAAQQTVEVNGSTPLVDPTTASLGTVVGEKEIDHLPLNLRQVGALALTVPGTVDTSGRSLSSAVANGSGFNDTSYSGAGGYSGGNLLLIDGMISRALNNGSFALNPPPEMVKEFRIQNNVYDAAFGLTSGTVMNLITRSGTSSIHGNVWDYVRNRDLGTARGYFQTPDVSPSLPEYTRNQFGGDVGFPVLKNRLFLFGAYEGMRLTQANASNARVPTIAEKQGNFGSLLTGTSHNLCGAGGPGNLNYDTGQLFDPGTESNYTCPNGSVILVGTPIPNNDIAAYRGGIAHFDPVAQRVLATIPDPNNGQFYLNLAPNTDHRNQYDGRMDWNLSAKDLVFARYILGTSDQVSPGAYSPFGTRQHFRGHNAVVGWSRTFAPTLFNDVRIGYQNNYLSYGCLGCPRKAGTLASFGISGLAASNPTFEEYPSVTFTNFSGWGDGGYSPEILPDSLYKFEDTLTMIAGKHNLSFGIDLNFWQTDGVEDPAQVNGVLNFYGQFSSLAGQSSAATSAADVADFELGYPGGGSYTKNAFATRLTGGNWLGTFVQDNFRVNPNLTIEAGIRWDYRRQPHERNNKLAAFLPLSKTYQPGNALLITALPSSENDALCSQAYLLSATGQCLVATAEQRAKLGFHGNQVSQVSYGPGHGDFSPRFAISARPTGSDKLVVHAGFGVFLDLPLTNQVGATNDNNPVFTQTPNYITSFGAPPPLTGGVPTTTQNMFVNVNLPTLDQTSAMFVPSPYYRTPTVYEWSASVQSQMAQDLAVEIAYIGNRGDHEDYLHLNANQPKPGVTPLQSRRPWPDFGQLRFDTYDAYSNYNALTVKVTKRVSHGLSGLVGYTYSKALDNNSGTSETEAPPQDDNNPQAEYGVADTSLRHRFIASGIYQLPFGKGMMFLGSSGPLMNTAVGGWELSAILQIQSGYPFTVTSVNDYSNTDASSPRPDRVCRGKGPKTLEEWFDVNCFTTTALQQALTNGTPRFGNSGRNILTGPGMTNVDASVIKTIPIRDRFNAEFRGDVFNLFNHPNFALPNVTIGSGVVGIISNTAGHNREIQLSLKLSF